LRSTSTILPWMPSNGSELIRTVSRRLFAHRRQESIDFVRLKRDGLAVGAHESGHPGCVSHQVSGLVVEFHLDDDVPGEDLVLAHLAAPAARAP